MLVWSNCALYNKPTAAVGQAGLNARKHFEELWERSKLGEGLRNPRRSTAGQAPSKWEGDEQPRDRAAPSSSARSARPPPVRPLCLLSPFPLSSCRCQGRLMMGSSWSACMMLPCNYAPDPVPPRVLVDTWHQMCV